MSALNCSSWCGSIMSSPLNAVMIVLLIASRASHYLFHFSNFIDNMGKENVILFYFAQIQTFCCITLWTIGSMGALSCVMVAWLTPIFALLLASDLSFYAPSRLSTPHLAICTLFHLIFILSALFCEAPVLKLNHYSLNCTVLNILFLTHFTLHCRLAGIVHTDQRSLCGLHFQIHQVVVCSSYKSVRYQWLLTTIQCTCQRCLLYCL